MRRQCTRKYSRYDAVIQHGDTAFLGSTQLLVFISITANYPLEDESAPADRLVRFFLCHIKGHCVGAVAAITLFCDADCGQLCQKIEGRYLPHQRKKLMPYPVSGLRKIFIFFFAAIEFSHSPLHSVVRKGDTDKPISFSRSR